MTRPGFIVPNANLVAPDLQASQPDQGDFLVLGNNQYGVITGCKPVMSFPTVTLATDILLSTAHVLVCAGTPYLLSGAASVTLAGQGPTGRWDLVVFDSQNGGFKVITGTPADNPVFPDITDTMVVLGAVSVPGVGTGATPTLIDKRVFLPTTLVGDSASPTLIRTYDTSGPTPTIVVNINGEGKVSWGTDTRLEKTAPGVLTVTDELRAKILTATVSATVAGSPVITEDTISGFWPVIPASATIPVGTVIMSFASASAMSGWLPLFGQTVPLGDAGGLSSVHPSWVHGGYITLPDMRGRFPLGGGFISAAQPGFVDPSSPNGTRINDHGATSVALTTDNLPAHVHETGSTTGSGGSHGHSASSHAGGSHVHPIGGWGPALPTGAGVRVLLTANAGVEFPNPSDTNARAGGEHSHTITVNSAAAHTHTLPTHNSVGQGVPVIVTPPSLSIYFYIKV